MVTGAWPDVSLGPLKSMTVIVSTCLYPEACSLPTALVHESKIVMVGPILFAASLSPAQATTASAPLQFKMQARLKKGSLKSAEVMT
jgi:hypothetical protein